MDDATTLVGGNKDNPIPLGMSSFGVEDRKQFGRNIRLAMACIEGPVEPVKIKAMPSDEQAIRQRLKTLSQDITSYHADLLELLVRFDDLEGWKSSGASHCAAWMNLEMGISLQLGWEYLRVGRKLRSLPTTTALFRAGKLSWSKVRLIVSVANVDDPDAEKTLCHAALDASVTEVKRLCDGYRWSDDENSDGENDRALKQWDSRSLTWNEISNGSTRIQLVLPPEIAQAFLNSVEHSLKKLDDAESEAQSNISQRRADAAVLMAETSLQSADREFATADRYQVIVSVDSSKLITATNDNCASFKRPSVKGASAIAQETARRIACDCSVTTNTITNGEPTNIGRKSRLWPSAMARAIKERDQHCQFYGCSQTHNLQIHHITHWADGGSTSVENGVCVCQYHHTRLHEGGYSIQRVESNELYLDEQFAQQQHPDDVGMFGFEKELRNNRKSFNKIRRLSPTRYRFRIVDAQGHDIRYKLKIPAHIQSDSNFDNNKIHNPITPNHSTRVEYKEPVLGDTHCPMSEQSCERIEYESSGSGGFRGFKYSSSEQSSSNVAEQPAGYYVAASLEHQAPPGSIQLHPSTV